MLKNLRMDNPERPVLDPMSRVGVLETASDLITGSRAEAYGDWDTQASRVARMWSVLLDCEVLPEQIAPMLIALKQIRGMTARDVDSWVDICGYAALQAEYFPKTDDPS